MRTADPADSWMTLCPSSCSAFKSSVSTVIAFYVCMESILIISNHSYQKIKQIIAVLTFGDLLFW